MFEIVIILVLILINGLFAASEIAVVSSRKVRLQTMAQEGDDKAAQALDLIGNPNRFLATVQIGITLVGTLASVFGGARVADVLQEWLNNVPFLRPYSGPLSVGMVVLMITYLSLVLGELAPKRLALLNPEGFTRQVAKGFLMLSAVASPAVRFLTWSSRIVVGLFAGEREVKPEITEEEIEAFLRTGTAEGVLEKGEEELLQSVLDLSDTQVRMIMVPRTAIVGIEAGQPLRAVISRVAETHLSRFPIYRDDLDHIVGIVNVQDLIGLEETQLDQPVESLVRPPLFLTEGMTVFRALERFRRHRGQMAIVLDEYAGTAGLVTLEDILEEIVGDLGDEYDAAREPEIHPRGRAAWIVDGLTSIEHLKEELALERLEGEEEYSFETVAGFVLSHLGEIPKPGDFFCSAGYRFEVVRMDRHRVAQVMVSRLPRPVGRAETMSCPTKPPAGE